MSSASLEHPERSFSAKSSASTRWTQLAESMDSFRSAGGHRAFLANLKLSVSDPGGGRALEVCAAGAGEPLEATLRRVRKLGFDEVAVRAPANTTEVLTQVRDAWASAMSD
jgi:hypothetical protein